MLENFHLAAIVKAKAQIRLLQIPLHQQLQNSLAESWDEQADKFVQDIEEIDFNGGYKPEEQERFCLSNYEPPDWLANEDSQTLENLDTIAADDELTDQIAGIIGMARNTQGEETVLFQNFSRSKVIKPGMSLILDGNTYKSNERPGLALAFALSAVYMPSERKLLFQNFRTVNSFLPLSDYYQEASEQQIREVLDHPRLAAEDPDAVVANANQWSRKRFAMLMDSGVLGQYSADDIRSRSNGHNVDIRVSDGKIAFPADKAEAKKLLQFLNEELYRGPITETLFETNSKRQAT